MTAIYYCYYMTFLIVLDFSEEKATIYEKYLNLNAKNLRSENLCHTQTPLKGCCIHVNTVWALQVQETAWIQQSDGNFFCYFGTFGLLIHIL